MAFAFAWALLCSLSLVLLIAPPSPAQEAAWLQADGSPPALTEDALPWQSSFGLEFDWQRITPAPASLYLPPQIRLTAEDLSCRAGILIDCDLGMVLFEKNADLPLPPASLTKLLTAWVVLQQADDLNQVLTLQDGDFAGLYEQHASLSGFSSGETVSYRDLLYSLLLVSGCDSAQALARGVAGDETAFSERMNAQAAKLGLKQSHFTNASGLHGESHYTTAREMAAIFQAALADQRLRDILSAGSYFCPPTAQHPEGLLLHSYFFWRLNNDYCGERLPNRVAIAGGKTGYHSQAGLCLAAYARKYGHTYIAVVLSCPGNSHTEQYNFSDVIKLLEQL
ncbi:MAG: serine hydrolase [Firmicutes bacterium]|nr:serine hydrolase [Bacillota bacterium]